MSRRRTKKKDVLVRLEENTDLVAYTVLAVFALAYLGFPLINNKTEHTIFTPGGGSGSGGSGSSGGGGWMMAPGQ